MHCSTRIWWLWQQLLMKLIWVSFLCRVEYCYHYLMRIRINCTAAIMLSFLCIIWSNLSARHFLNCGLCVGGICKSHHHVILRITRSPFKEVGTEFLGFPINFSHLILEIWSSQSSGDHWLMRLKLLFYFIMSRVFPYSRYANARHMDGVLERHVIIICCIAGKSCVRKL